MVIASVIIPAHNEERHIEKTIQSLLSQDLQDIEIIVVDNGSRDRTPEIVGKYAAQHPDKVRLIKLGRNAGPGGARNIGAAASKGDVLVFLDADMTFPPDFIRKLVMPIASGKCLATVHARELVGNTENPWVKVQGQEIKHEAPTDNWPRFRAIDKRYFLENGGFDPSFGYHDDRFLRGGARVNALVIRDAVCYHNNPDSAYEIFRRNFWMGRTFIAISLYERGINGLKHVLYVTGARAMEILALPFTGLFAWGFLTGGNPFLTLPLSLPGGLFFFLCYRQRVLKVRGWRERLVLRLFYVPAYRLVRAAGLLSGVVVSLMRGIKMRYEIVAGPSGSQPPSPSDRRSPSLRDTHL